MAYEYKQLAEYRNIPFKAGVQRIENSPNEIFVGLTAFLGGPQFREVEIIRPDNATQYSPRDCVADASPDGDSHGIELARLDGLSGRINALVIKTDNYDWVSGLRVVLYNAEPATFIADNESWPGKMYADSVIGWIDVLEMDSDGVETGAGSFGIAAPKNPIHFVCASDSKKIYFQMFLPTGTDPNPIAEQKFSLGFYFDQN